MTKKIYVGRLANGTTDQDLQDHFSTAGTVVQAAVSRNRLTGKMENFGYVRMTNDLETAAALKLDNSLIKKSRIMVKEAHDLDQERKNYGSYRRYGK